MDEMLAALARWLRAAGHDAALAPPSAPDRGLIDQARAEGRVLVSRDRALVAAAQGVRAVLLPDGDLDRQAAALGRALGLDWRCAPFTRCMIDNTPLRPATAEEIAAMPETSRSRPGPFRACPRCGRLFWPGSHVRRMSERLERWAAAAAGDEASADGRGLAPQAQAAASSRKSPNCAASARRKGGRKVQRST